jgi:HD-like signal output (HDOD) protein
LHKLLPIYRIQATSYEVLKSFVNIDVTAERVAASLAANPYYSYQFFRNIESMGKREELPSAESAVVLYGMQNSRNFILAMQLIRSITGTHPEWSKEGKLKTVPSDVLKYALKIEEILAGNKSGYADTAYAGGLMFDIVANYALQVVEDKKRISDVIETSYKHGLLSAKIGMELARNIPEFGFTKYIFSACLIHDIGKLAIAVLDPGYLNFLEECSNRGLPRTVRVFAEQQQYGVNHALLGGLLARAFKIFLPVEKAIFYHHAPYLLRASNKNLYQLAAMICLATNMASNFKKVDKADDPVLLSWNTPELGGFKVNARMMMNASAKIL